MSDFKSQSARIALNVVGVRISAATYYRNEFQSLSTAKLAELKGRKAVAHDLATGWAELEKALETAIESGDADAKRRYTSGLAVMRSNYNREAKKVLGFGVTVKKGKLVRAVQRNKKQDPKLALIAQITEALKAGDMATVKRVAKSLDIKAGE